MIRLVGQKSPNQDFGKHIKSSPNAKCDSSWRGQYAYSTIAWPEAVNHFPCSTHLSIKFPLLIKPEMLNLNDISCFKIIRKHRIFITIIFKYLL